MRYFTTVLLEGTKQFLDTLDDKSAGKVTSIMREAEEMIDPEIFKKLRDGIWEFRIRFAKSQIRILAFWDKTDRQNTLVIAAHGFIKKVDKVPNKEIRRALQIRQQYFEHK